MLLNADELIARMIQLSPNARATHEQQRYLINTDPDEVDDEVIVDTLFADVITDLNEIGVEIDGHIHALNTYYDIEQFLKLCDFILPGPLFQRLQESPVLTSAYRNILDGGVGDDESTLEAILHYIADCDMTLAPDYGPYIQKIIGEIRSTPQFDTYLQNLLAITTERIIPIDDDRRDAFDAYVVRLDERFSTILSVWENQWPSLSAVWKRLKRRATIYQNLITSPNIAPTAALLFAAPDHIRTQAATVQSVRDFLADSTFHLEHYRRDGFILDTLGAASLILRQAVEASHADDFARRVKDMLAALSHAGVSIPENTLTTVRILMSLRTSMWPQ